MCNMCLKSPGALPAGAGLRLQLSAHAMAQVALTDIHPAWTENALAGLRKGSLLTCTLLSEIASDKPGKHTKLDAQSAQHHAG